MTISAATAISEHYGATGKLLHQNFNESHNPASSGSLTSAANGYDWSGGPWIAGFRDGRRTLRARPHAGNGGHHGLLDPGGICRVLSRRTTFSHTLASFGA